MRNIRTSATAFDDRAIIEDVRIEGVKDPNCVDASNEGCPNAGTRQIGLWIGASHTQLRRAYVRDVFMAGIAAGRVLGSDPAIPHIVSGFSATDLDIDRIGLDDSSAVPGKEAGVGLSLRERFVMQM